jgi:hypothetical protein
VLPLHEEGDADLKASHGLDVFYVQNAVLRAQMETALQGKFQPPRDSAAAVADHTDEASTWEHCLASLEKSHPPTFRRPEDVMQLHAQVLFDLAASTGGVSLFPRHYFQRVCRSTPLLMWGNFCSLVAHRFRFALVGEQRVPAFVHFTASSAHHHQQLSVLSTSVHDEPRWPASRFFVPHKCPSGEDSVLVGHTDDGRSVCGTLEVHGGTVTLGGLLRASGWEKDASELCALLQHSVQCTVWDAQSAGLAPDRGAVVQAVRAILDALQSPAEVRRSVGQVLFGTDFKSLAGCGGGGGVPWALESLLSARLHVRPLVRALVEGGWEEKYYRLQKLLCVSGLGVWIVAEALEDWSIIMATGVRHREKDLLRIARTRGRPWRTAEGARGGCHYLYKMLRLHCGLKQISPCQAQRPRHVLVLEHTPPDLQGVVWVVHLCVSKKVQPSLLLRTLNFVACMQGRGRHPVLVQAAEAFAQAVSEEQERLARVTVLDNAPTGRAPRSVFLVNLVERFLVTPSTRPPKEAQSSEELLTSFAKFVTLPVERMLHEYHATLCATNTCTHRLQRRLRAQTL